MKAIIPIFSFALLATTAHGQSAQERLGRAWKQFEQDSQLRAGIASLYVVEMESGKPVFERNAQIGLAPASTQKVITAATAFDLLGPKFRFETKLVGNGAIVKDTLKGSLWIIGGGDPTLGSTRWQQTAPQAVLSRFTDKLRQRGVRYYESIGVGSPGWESEATPDGWIWQDIGQYYGAPATGVNWRENRFEVTLQAGSKENEPVRMTNPTPWNVNMQVRTAPAGTGDNSYFYPVMGGGYMLRGTVGAGKTYTVQGSVADPGNWFFQSFVKQLNDQGIRSLPANIQFSAAADTEIVIHTELSPVLDTMNYWLLRESINLYGEALLKAIAIKEKGFADTRLGVQAIREFWNEKGIDPTELGIRDGSGLSPEARVTTRAQVSVLRWAVTQPWFSSFRSGFPEPNGMKMKSGTISGVKAYCGYHKAKDGKEYVFSFIVNNYNGRENDIRNKMFRVLDELK